MEHLSRWHHSFPCEWSTFLPLRYCSSDRTMTYTMPWDWFSILLNSVDTERLGRRALHSCWTGTTILGTIKILVRWCLHKLLGVLCLPQNDVPQILCSTRSQKFSRDLCDDIHVGLAFKELVPRRRRRRPNRSHFRWNAHRNLNNCIVIIAPTIKSCRSWLLQ